MEEDVVTTEDLEDVLNFHSTYSEREGEVEHLCATINYALDKFLSIIVKKMREEDRENSDI